MIPEIGQIALILALMLAITQATLPLIGAARGILVQQSPAERHGGPSVGCDVRDQHRLSPLHAADLESVSTIDSRAAGRSRFESLVTGSGHGRAPAHALHGLRGNVRGLRVRD